MTEQRKDHYFHLAAAISAFLLPLILYIVNAPPSLGFADAAEFALVAKINSIAHPPGFPAYTYLAHLWDSFGSNIFSNTFISLTWFSAVSASAAILMLYYACYHLLILESKKGAAVSAWFATISIATGVTYWHWSHNIEVYAFHAFAFSLLLYGLVKMQITKKIGYALAAGAGLGMCLANHHLTVVLFIPFIIVGLFYHSFSVRTTRPKGGLKTMIFNKCNIALVASSAFFMVMFYLYMYFRAGEELSFKFGNPDSWDRLIYHLSGGAWIKNTTTEVSGLISLRFPYFMTLLYEQVFLFIPFLLAGIYVMRKRISLLFIIVGYFLVVLIYQLRIDQTSDTDAYMILPFMLLSIIIAWGIRYAMNRFRVLIYIIPAMTLIQIGVNFQKTNAKDFDVSTSLMNVLNESAPEGAVILISDWTLVSQYHYYRIVENFRPDLVVLNYDLKFTNYRILPNLYPAFYDSVSVSYNSFIKKLGKSHPQEIYNTGCTLDTPELMQSYIDVVNRIKQYCENNNKVFMTDPKAFVFMLQNKIMTTSSHVSGSFVSSKATGMGTAFIDLPFKWLDSPLLMRQPAATDKIVDFEAMLDFHRNYYRSTQNDELYLRADNSYNRIKSLQRKIKKHMPFVYRPKGQ